VLAVAAQEGRMLLSHDHHTLPRHFGDFITAQASPGVIIMPQRMLISVAVEWIMTIWAARCPFRKSYASLFGRHPRVE
jgi:hypothetical protein